MDGKQVPQRAEKPDQEPSVCPSVLTGVEIDDMNARRTSEPETEWTMMKGR